MAQKRMFDKRVVESDLFTDLPNSSKALYFMAGMAADDRGFFQPRRLQKMCGFTDDDFKILIAKRFFLTFESGVMVVTDWNKNNWLDKRRINETEYIEELNMLRLINEKYELINGCLANAKPMLRENSIVENSIDKINIKEESKEEKALSLPESTTLSKREYFRKPTLEEIKDYIQERNSNIDPNTFYDFYESKNWYVGKNKMKDWKACIRTWEQRNPKQKVPEWLHKDFKVEQLTKKELEELEKEMKEFIND